MGRFCEAAIVLVARKPIQVHVRARFTSHPRSRAGNDVATARSHIAPGNVTSGYFFRIGDSENYA